MSDTLTLADIRAAAAFIGEHAAPRHADGCYHVHISSRAAECLRVDAIDGSLRPASDFASWAAYFHAHEHILFDGADLPIVGVIDDVDVIRAHARMYRRWQSVVARRKSARKRRRGW